MPWTFSHPAAILPFKRLCPAYLSLPALAIGATVPDAGYYFGLYSLGTYTHSWPGWVVAGLPTGLLLLFVFYAVRRPFWHLLPQPHRGALSSLVSSPWSLRPAQLAIYSVSVLIGTMTHVIWDSFTHNWGWAALRIPALQKQWLTVGPARFEGYSVMQHLSTLVGFSLLAIAYFSFLKQQPRQPRVPGEDRTRYLIILGSATVALFVALSLAASGLATSTALHPIRRFVFQTAVYGASIFAVLALICGWIYSRKQRK